MFTIISNEGNANQNHNGYHLTPIKTTSKRSPTANAEEDVEKWKPSTLLVGMYIGAAGFERCMDLSV